MKNKSSQSINCRSNLYLSRNENLRVVNRATFVSMRCMKLKMLISVLSKTKTETHVIYFDYFVPLFGQNG